MLKIIPLILCGGQGTRLWPLSRSSYPKQFIPITINSDKSPLQQTLIRISDIDNIDNPIIICNEEHRFLVAEQLRAIGTKPMAIILEPEGKNTAPAISLGALKALKENSDSILLVLPADHIIKEVNIFQQILKKGFSYARKDNLVTFGIVPDRPEIGYGYIESEEVLDKNKVDGSRIKKFIEKPDKDTAKELIRSSRYTWNSGMFIFKTKLILSELNKYSPTILTTCKKAFENSIKDLDFIRVDESSFSKVPNLPIDIAVMEKTDKGIVIPLEAGWSDIGSWNSIWENESKDSYNNVKEGKIISDKSSGCYLKSDNRLLVTIGLKDLIVVDTLDATLVASKQNVDEIKSVVNKLKDKGYEEGSLDKKIYRPWGSYTSLLSNKKWLVKIIEVKPKGKLSLQMHYHRSEHWVVVNGEAKVQIEEQEFLLQENQSTFIPLGAKHRLSNPGAKSLRIIEIQSGSYIGEDDIVRFKDDYGREN